MKKKIELKVGETYASHMTQFTVIAEVVASAFGDGKGKGKKAKPDVDISQQSPEQWQRSMELLFTGRM